LALVRGLEADDMAEALSKPLTLESFLAWEERQDLRYEFDGFRVIGMTGGTYAHARIQANLLRSLGNRLDGAPCRAVGSELKVQTATSVRYPDAFVVCAPIPLDATVARDPVVIFEILSPRSANDDLGGKKAEYQALPSVRSYIVLQQTHRSAQAFRRIEETTPDDETSGEWTFEFVVGSDAVIALPEIGVTIPLAEIYDGVLPPSAPPSGPIGDDIQADA
jgi:Uma2 family endonuclease